MVAKWFRGAGGGCGGQARLGRRASRLAGEYDHGARGSRAWEGKREATTTALGFAGAPTNPSVAVAVGFEAAGWCRHVVRKKKPWAVVVVARKKERARVGGLHWAAWSRARPNVVLVGGRLPWSAHRTPQEFGPQMES
jgi:hypothetical protein